MAIWAIADLHLSFGVPNKKMDRFGAHWQDHPQKVESAWRQLVKEEDLVLIAGDISWALHLSDAVADLEWIGQLPGTKVLIKGNHDYWWGSLAKIEKILPPSCHLIQNCAFHWKEVAIAGARLWDAPELDFNDLINFTGAKAKEVLTITDFSKESLKIYERELHRLEVSLKQMQTDASIKIAMTHYPPIGAKGEPSAASQLLEKYQINHCVFGHLHNVKKEANCFGVHRGVHYHLVAADYLENFSPIKIVD